MARERRFKGPDVTRCSTCRAPIVWSRTASGKRMPMDAAPVEDGDFVFDDDGVVRRIVSTHDLDPHRDRFHSHFVTCPDRDLHRQPREVHNQMGGH